MKKRTLVALSLLAVASLASCGDKGLSKDEANTLISGFDKSISTTVSISFTNDFTLDVDQESMSSFERDVEDTVTFDLDLTSGSLYLYGKNVGIDKNSETTTTTSEVLLYQDGGTYYYLTSTMGEAQALKDESEALSKIDELMENISSRNDGSLTTTALLYDGLISYEHREFMLGSKNVGVDMMDDPTSISKTEAGGLSVVSDFDYIGYKTDAGTSELHGDDTTSAATSTVLTDEKGRVLSYELTYNDATLEMPITTPAPILTLSGSRKLEANYGVTLEKKTTIDHEAQYGTVEIPSEFVGGEVSVKTCAPNDFMNMSDILSDGKVQVGNWVCIKPSPYGSNTIKSVMLGSNGTPLADPSVAGGWYCFAMTSGNNKVTVIFEGSDVPTQEKATVKYSCDENVTVLAVNYYDLSNPTSQTPLPEDGSVEVGKWVGFSLEAKEGYDIKVLNGTAEVSMMYNMYNINIKEATTYNITITGVAK